MKVGGRDAAVAGHLACCAARTGSITKRAAATAPGDTRAKAERSRPTLGLSLHAPRNLYTGVDEGLTKKVAGLRGSPGLSDPVPRPVRPHSPSVRARFRLDAAFASLAARWIAQI